MNYLDCTALELAEKIRSGECRVSEVLEQTFKRIEETEPDYNCYISLDREGAFEAAGRVQKCMDEGRPAGPLAGVPFIIKDNICQAGRLTTCGSKMLEHFKPVYSGEAVERLERAGAVIIGKANMDEFAMGSTTETSYFGVTRNPWNKEHVPGGSSGGCAAALAAGSCFGALGSDTGGSIRQPAAHCGVVGLKPTYGRVSRYGLIAHASSMDQVGPMARTVEDCAAILQVISGMDSKDSTSAKEAVPDYLQMLNGGVEGMRIGIPVNYLDEAVSGPIRDAVYEAADILRQLGARVEEITLRYTEYAIPAYYTIASAEASSNLERYDGIKYGFRHPEFDSLDTLYKRTRSQGFGPEVKRRIMMGTFVLSEGYYESYYLQALKVRGLIRRAYEEAFAKLDVIVMPVTATSAPKLGVSLRDPIRLYPSDLYTVSANLAGLPAISVPAGLDAKGMPIGVQMMGAAFREDTILRAAYAYEQEKKACRKNSKQ